MMQYPHSELWAKSADRERRELKGESLLTHSLNTAMVAHAICRRLPLSETERTALEKDLVEACAYHDLGKAATGFQHMLRDSQQRWGHRHETLSTAIAFHLNPELDPCARFAILTHHRSIPRDINAEREKDLPWDELPPHFGQLADKTWREMIAEVRANFEAFSDLLARLAKSLSLSQQPLTRDAPLWDLGIPPTWLARESNYQKTINPQTKWRASLLRGLLITSDHLASARDVNTGAHFKPLDVPRFSDYSARIAERELPAGISPLPFQQRTGETDGDAILKAPTGSGKTLAALLWATHNQVENGRFFYVLPYTASINAMADRLKRIFDGGASGSQSYVGVLHHRNADYLFRTMEDDLPQRRNKSARLLSGLAREMYHPIRICTPHQILRFALRGRGWETGLAEFPRACFIFDEIHAFEPLLTGLTLATVRLLKSMGARVLFASATIPRFLEEIIRREAEIADEKIIAPDPLNERDAAVLNKVRHRIEVRVGSLLESLPRIADEIMTSGETALVVCNHVATSQEAYRRLSSDYGLPAMLLHARFNGRDRNEIEKAITSEAKPRVLVATQAVEVSLDIDYDRGYSEPAPADALGQRFGRINRKAKRPAPAPVVIFTEPSAGHLYDQQLTERTVALLRDSGELSEDMLTEIVNEVYGEGYTGIALEEFNRGISNRLINDFRREIVAGTHRAWTDDILDKTDGQIEVLPDCLLSEFTDLRAAQRYVEARQLLVPVRIGQKFKMEKLDAIKFDKKLGEWITTLQYTSELGLDLSAKSENII